MNVDKALQNAAQMFDVVSDSARLDAELLLMFVLAVPRSHLFAHPERELTPEEADQFMQLTGRRARNESVAYLTGEKEFWSMQFLVTPETLVPRPETELLVEEALKRIPVNSGMRVLDLGTGSGAIAVAIASERPGCRIVATDLSPAAIAIATENANRHQLSNVEFGQGSWLEAVGDSVFDLIVSNPPYIASGDAAMSKLTHEPRDALVSGVDGLDAIRRIAATAGGHLETGGALLIEHGADQALAVATILEEHDWRDLRCLPDLSGLPRVTACVCP
jgi:release factor glutamine methyltransferase